jgi:endonuclease-8
VPEGHTIHLYGRDHERLLAGGPVRASSPQMRFVEGAAAVDGHVLDSVEAYGKHLFYWFDGAPLIHIHLGLIGRFFTHPAPAPVPRPTIRLRLENDRGAVDLVGTQYVSLITADERGQILSRLGPDPLRRRADPEVAWAVLRRRRTATIGEALMDQRVVAGVGNVFRAESLFAHALHPLVPAASLSHDEWLALWDTVVRMLKDGVRRRRIVTVPRELRGPKDTPATYVYRQDTCRRCGTPVSRFPLAGRWAYACPLCQPPP